MTNNGFDSEYVTAGFYRAGPRILKEKDVLLLNTSPLCASTSVIY